MSADNFYLVRRAGDRWAVSLEFMSQALDGETAPIDDPALRWFEDERSAIEFASSQLAEYSVEVAEGDHAADTRAARLRQLAVSLAPRTRLRGARHSVSHGRCTSTLRMGDLTVTITGAEEQAQTVLDLAEWFRATAPESQ